MVLFSVFWFGPCDNPPREDHEKRAKERGNEILEGNLQLSEAEVDSEQPEQLAADHRAGHADQEVRPAAQALLFQSDSAPRESAREAADNDPHDDLAYVHDLDGTLCELKTYTVWPKNIAHFRTALIFKCPGCLFDYQSLEITRVALYTLSSKRLTSFKV
jgi:hypothetical protein